MSDERNWREAKIPQWAKDSIAAELTQYQMTAALAWPTEPKPEPLPFRWGDYDREYGTPIAGTYWNAVWSIGSGRVSKVHLDRNEGKVQRWKYWLFSSDGENWSTSAVRGPMFANEHDARLWLLWEACEEFARKLMKLREAVSQ